MGFRIGLAGFALAALSMAACGDGAAGSRDVEASQGNERWELRLRIPGEVRAGEMTAVELSLKNVSDETLTADTDCVTNFGLKVFDSQGEVVFDWYDFVIETEFKGHVPGCPPLWKDVAPGGTLEQTVSFLVDDPGEYTVRPQPPTESVGIGDQPIGLSLSVRVRAK